MKSGNIRGDAGFVNSPLLLLIMILLLILDQLKGEIRSKIRIRSKREFAHPHCHSPAFVE